MNNMINSVDDVAIPTQRKKCDSRPIDSTKIRINWGGEAYGCPRREHIEEYEIEIIAMISVTIRPE